MPPEATRKFLRSMFEAAVAAAMPDQCVPQNLPARPKGRTIVVGTGKASAAMAQVLEKSWNGPLSGLIVTRYGHAVACEQIEIIEAAHPVPDDAGASGARRMLAMMQGLSRDDLVIALISGGGSALLSLPAEGISVEEKRAINRALLKSGAPISEMNCVRKHLSAIKGGRLAAAAHPARVVSLVISDVPGDDLAAVGSGPTVADPTTFAQARAIIAKYHIDAPKSVIRHLEQAVDETPKPGDPRLAGAETKLIASPQKSLEAAAAIARKAGIAPLILGNSIEGEAREVGFVMAGIALQSRRFGQPLPAPCVLISGGETTVTVRGNGAGGRNVEFLLALALKLDGAENITGLAADTDGVDGAREVAGAFITPDTLSRARAMGIDPWASLANNDGHGFFEKLGDQIITGPTLTNVNDFRAVYIGQGQEMTDRSYYAPPGGLPPQTALLTDRAVFTEAYAVIPKGVLRDITVSYFPFWEKTRAWVLSRPLSGFAETFSQYIMEVKPDGGSDRPEPDPHAEGVLFVVEGELNLTLAGTAHAMQPGGYAYIPAGAKWSVRNKSTGPVKFHWIRKAYDPVEGLGIPEAFVVNEKDIAPIPMPDTNGVWATTRFVSHDDMRHDMHVTIVTFEPGGVIPFAETHVMEHGLYVLEGKAVYRLNQDWVEVEAGDYMWLRAFCPQACYAGGPGRFRYLLYKDVNRHMKLGGT